jgi:hypothetical protein
VIDSSAMLLVMLVEQVIQRQAVSLNKLLHESLHS